MSNISHKTGFLFVERDLIERDGLAPVESWHRTLRGALAARDRSDIGGRIYRLTGDDSSEEVAK